VQLHGGNGNDSLTGGEGNDTLTGGAGNDTIFGHSGADVINAGAGDNLITGVGDGADIITHNTPSSSVIIEIIESDLVTLIAEQTGAFVIMRDGTYGASLNAAASTAAISVEGNIGNDTLIGGLGHDTIEGEQGADRLTGGGGNDIFIYTGYSTGVTLATADTITDFTTGSDQIATGLASVPSVSIVDGNTYDFASFSTNAGLWFNGGGGSYGVFVAYNAQASGDAWVAINNDGINNFNVGDSLIVLSGINLAAEIAASDFSPFLSPT